MYKLGYLYIRMTNRSEGAVYFDNLSIKHWAPMVRVTYDYYPYGLTWENPKLPTDPNAVHDHAYQDKEFQFAEFTTGHGLALYDFHARMYDPATARWLVPDPAAQFANPYLAMGNNPVVGIDPDGMFVWDTWLRGFVSGFFSTGSHRWKAAWNEANHRANNDLRILGGLFATDENNNNGFQNAWEILTRFTWQLPQTIGGILTAYQYNFFGKVNSVKYKYGATVVQTDVEPVMGVTQGSYIVGDNSLEADANNDLFQHEYGHYLQSKRIGWGYYNRVGIPSLLSKKGRHTYHPFEQDANRRAFMYFNREVDGFYRSGSDTREGGWDFYSNPIGLSPDNNTRGQYWDYNDAIQRDFLNDNFAVKAKWYDTFFWYYSIGLVHTLVYNSKL
jgi:RHS repeat-associated protein